MFAVIGASRPDHDFWTKVSVAVGCTGLAMMGPGFGLIARGVGIAGLISTLRTMADRHDVRPVRLCYGNRDWDDVAFRDELEQLKDRLDLI